MSGLGGGSVDQVAVACRARGVSFLVLVKPHLLHRDGTVRLVQAMAPAHAAAARAVHVNDLVRRVTAYALEQPASSESAAAAEGRSLAKAHSSSPSVVLVGKCADPAATLQRVANLLAAGPTDAAAVLVVDAPLLLLRRVATLHMAGDAVHVADFPPKYQPALLALQDRLAVMTDEVEEGRRSKKSGGAAQSTALLFSCVDARFDLVYLDASADAASSKAASTKGAKDKRRGSASSSNTGARR
jgi:hypothetical protein